MTNSACALLAGYLWLSTLILGYILLTVFSTATMDAREGLSIRLYVLYIARLVGINPYNTLTAYVSHSQNDKTVVF
jgi:hypothetical protein